MYKNVYLYAEAPQSFRSQETNPETTGGNQAER